MKYLKHISESIDNRTKNDVELKNNRLILKNWLADHPFQGVEEIVKHDRVNGVNYIDIYFKNDSYLSIFQKNIFRKNNQEILNSNKDMIEWRVYEPNRTYIYENREKFLSWCDKLLIKCEMDRSVLKELEEVINSKEPI